VGFDKTTLRLDPDAVIVAITAYGMPARVAIVVQNDGDRLSTGMFDPARGVNTGCLPDTQFPGPCVSYAVVRKGASVNITAGNSRAGFWPNLDFLRGPGCDLGRTGDRDHVCTITVSADVEFVAVYYGEDTPNGLYQFPKCPAGEALERARASSQWARRC
jgi:hypothetical protein